MLIRLRHGVRLQNVIKVLACALAGILYFAFLFRESMHAYEQKKDKLAEIINAGIKSKTEVNVRIQKCWPKLYYIFFYILLLFFLTNNSPGENLALMASAHCWPQQRRQQL